MIETLDIPYRVYLKPDTYYERARHLFPSGIPCVIVAKHPHPETGEDVYGWQVYQTALTSEQHAALVDCIYAHCDTPKKVISEGSIYIKDTHVDSAYDENWIPMDAKLVYLANKAVQNAMSFKTATLVVSGLEVHLIISYLQLALLHPGASKLSLLNEVEEFLDRLIELIAQGDKEIEEFYQDGFDMNLDVEIPSVRIS